MPVGSALKFCRLAEGVVSLYPRFSGSSEWDIAAGHAIIREAGCRIVDLETEREPTYNKKSLSNHFFISHARHIKYDEIVLPDDLS